MCLLFADHVVIVVRPASRTNEERSRKEGSGRGADLGDFGDGVGERGGVEEDRLVESVVEDDNSVVESEEGLDRDITGAVGRTSCRSCAC